MLGRPDPDTPKTLVVTDVFPLPIEGFETRVIADDQDVVNYMIELGESLEVSLLACLRMSCGSRISYWKYESKHGELHIF